MRCVFLHTAEDLVDIEFSKAVEYSDNCYSINSRSTLNSEPLRAVCDLKKVMIVPARVIENETQEQLLDMNLMRVLAGN